MKKITLLLAMLISSIGFSQTYDLITNGDFEDGTAPWIAANFTVVNGEAFISTTNAVGNPWDSQLVHGSLEFENAKEYVFTFYAYAVANRDITVAIQNVGPWDDQFRQNFSLTTTKTKYTATFNATSSNSNAQIGFLMAGFGSTDGIYYDDISIVTAGTKPETCSDGIMNQDETGIDCGGVCNACPTPPTTAPTAPITRNAWDVISLYGEAYTSSGLNGVTWDEGADAVEETIAGNKVLKITAGNFIGFELPLGVDATDMTHFHMDYWIPVDYAIGQVFNPKLSNHEMAGGAPGESESKLYTIEITASDVKVWKSFDGTLDAFKRGNILQLLIADSGTISSSYIDNVYMYRAATTAGVSDNAALNVSMYPNPAAGVLNLSAANTIEDAIIYNVLGREVMGLNIDSNSAAIDVSGLSSGIYLIKYTIGDAVGTAKFIKE